MCRAGNFRASFTSVLPKGGGGGQYASTQGLGAWPWPNICCDGSLVVETAFRTGTERTAPAGSPHC